MLRVLFKLLFNILVDHFVFEYVIQISMAKVILSGSLIRIVCIAKYLQYPDIYVSKQISLCVRVIQ